MISPNPLKVINNLDSDLRFYVSQIAEKMSDKDFDRLVCSFSVLGFAGSTYGIAPLIFDNLKFVPLFSYIGFSGSTDLGYSVLYRYYLNERGENGELTLEENFALNLTRLARKINVGIGAGFILKPIYEFLTTKTFENPENLKKR